jgi:hypothetical protein
MLREAEERACRAQRRAAEAEALQRSAEEREAALLGETEALRRSAAEREAALLGRAEEAEARAAELEWQLARARQGAGAADARSLSQALSGETSTASFAELAAATGASRRRASWGAGGSAPSTAGSGVGRPSRSSASTRSVQCPPPFTLPL